MLRVNTDIVVDFLSSNDTSSGDKKLVYYCDQMRIEQSLNYVGRGRLLSSG
jgi:hypothetical protein